MYLLLYFSCWILLDQASRNFIGILKEAKSKYRFTEQELKDEVISIMFGVRILVYLFFILFLKVYNRIVI